MPVRSLALMALAALFCTPAVSADACDGLLIDSDAVYGDALCLPARPERVVVLDPSFSLGIGLELDLPIVGAPLTRMSDETLFQKATEAGITDLGFVTDPSLERLVALQPDLVIGFLGNSGLADSVYPMLSSLAPTVLDVSGDWQGYYGLIGALAGTEDRVADLFAEYEAHLARVQAVVPDKTVSILRITAWDFQVYTDSPDAYAPFAVAAAAGVKRSAYETAPEGPDLKRPDWEELAQLDGDILLYIVGGTNDSATNGRHEEVLGNPLWQMLPAVEAGRVHQIDPATWMEFSGLVSAHRVLDDIERLIVPQE